MTENILDRKPKQGFGFIYLIMLFGLSYIGKATTTLRERMKDGLGYFPNMKFNPKQAAIIKLGFEHLDIQILAEVPERVLDATEADYIKLYKAKEEGYNLINGCDYVSYQINSTGRTIADNMPAVYSDITVLLVNPVKHPDHNTIIDTFIYHGLKNIFDLYITECTPKENCGHFGVNVFYKEQNITLAKLILAYLLGVDPRFKTTYRIIHKNKDSRDNRLHNLYINGICLLNIYNAADRSKYKELLIKE